MQFFDITLSKNEKVMIGISVCKAGKLSSIQNSLYDEDFLMLLLFKGRILREGSENLLNSFPRS
ncbi:hypothetical protein COC46_17990 [Bacillus sp. AFS041924]|nr:hypothetical protein COC46_17990 [Bacillus sp. AFS041924]